MILIIMCLNNLELCKNWCGTGTYMGKCDIKLWNQFHLETNLL